jgi:O-antigen/teichoic acid export membrane protein
MDMINIIKKKIDSIRQDPHMREVARGTLSSLAARSLGVALAFVFNIILTRMLGAENSGLFFLALSVVLVAEVIGRFGLEYSLVRFVSGSYAQSDWGGIAGVWQHAIRLGFLVSILMTGLVAITAWPLANYIFSKPVLHELLLILSIAIVPLALTKLYAAALRGMKRILIFQLLQNALPIGFVMALLFPFILLLGWKVGVTLSYVVGWSIALGVGWWFWRAAFNLIPKAEPRFAHDKLLSSCVPMLGVTLSGLLLTQLPVFFIGVWSEAKDVAIFSVATRIALLGAFLLHSMLSILSPKFSELIASNKLEDLERLAKQAILVVALSIIPVWILVMSFPGQLLALFGEEFREGVSVLMVIFTGQVLFGIFGIGGEILMMGGYERLARRSLFVAVLICVVTCIILVPFYGGMGAAVAVALAYIGHAVICQIYIRQHFGFWLNFSSSKDKN